MPEAEARASVIAYTCFGWKPVWVMNLSMRACVSSVGAYLSVAFSASVVRSIAARM